MRESSPKTITGYCEPWSLRAGEKITLFSSSHSPGPAKLSLVRIDCGDPTSYGPGFSEEEIASDLPSRVELADQPLHPGSYATVDLQGLCATEQVELSFSLLATRPQEPQTLAWLETSRGHIAIVLDSGLICADVLGTLTPLRSQPLANRRWYELNLNVDVVFGKCTATVDTKPSVSPARDLLESSTEPTVFDIPAGNLDFVSLTFGGTPNGGCFDGRIGHPKLRADNLILEWDLSKEQ